MLKLIFVLYVAHSVSAQVGEYGQCGGDAYFGPKNCAAGLNCYKKDQWYSQCLKSCQPGFQCANSAGSTGSQTGSSNTKLQQLYDQCGGDGYNGPTACASGLTCYKKDQWYSQCLYSCPATWACTSGGSSSASTQSSAGSTTQGSTASTNALNTGKFPNCQFRFGMGFNGNKDYSAGDYLTIWIGSPSSTHGTNFNPYWHGEMVKSALKYSKQIVYYGYIIAFMARDEWGLQDCDVGTPSLCQRGSDYIRANRDKIVAKYKHYAAETAALAGKNTEVIWLIEPDFWQYYGDVSHQQNGALSGTYMRAFFDDIATAIKSEMPNSRISWDISAWLSESAMRTWWGFFATSPHIDFLHTSGGQSRADLSEIKQNELRWAFLSTLTGKRIIADTGYGVAGGSSGHTNAYDDVNNLLARIKDGVIAVSQANFRSDWKPIIDQLRQKLPKLC